MRRILFVSLFCFFFLNLFVFASVAREAEIVVTATRIETPLERIASSVSVISAEEIKEKGIVFAQDAMRVVPGMDVLQNGGSGTATSIFIRGANSEHTLVLMDGIELNDPISAGRSYDSSHIAVDDIERIEVIRGPQSVLYGSDAIGGVINIITKKGSGQPKYSFMAEGGAFDTFRENIGVRGGNEKMSYNLNASRIESDGISAASEGDGNDETDAYRNSALSGRVGFTISDSATIDLILKYIDSHNEIDAGAADDDSNAWQDGKQFFSRVESTISSLDGLLEQKVGVSYAKHDRKGRNDTDTDHPSDLSRDEYHARMTKFDLQNNLYLDGERNILTLGVETEEEKGESDYYSESMWGPYASVFEEKTARNNSLYLQEQMIVGDSFFPTAGVRFDDNNISGEATTYRLAAAYLLNDTGRKAKATYGTGFKSPSLYQLYSSYGDENLEAEKSQSWDIGLEESLLNKRLVVGVTYFNNDYRDLITYDYATSKYKNIAEAEAKGVEFELSFEAMSNLVFGFNYTYIDTRDKSTDKELLRRPKNKYSANINYGVVPKANVNLGLNYFGERNEYGGGRSPSYTVVDMAGSYKVNDEVKIFSRVDNLLDSGYEEVFGYGTPGVSAFAGVELLY